MSNQQDDQGVFVYGHQLTPSHEIRTVNGWTPVLETREDTGEFRTTAGWMNGGVGYIARTGNSPRLARRLSIEAMVLVAIQECNREAMQWMYSQHGAQPDMAKTISDHIEAWLDVEDKP